MSAGSEIEPLRPELAASAKLVQESISDGFLAAGRELNRIRPHLKHGELRPYLEATGVSRGMAWHLMRGAKAVDEGRVPEGLSLRGTLKAIADARETDDQMSSALDISDETEPVEPVESLPEPEPEPEPDPEPAPEPNPIPPDMEARINACLDDQDRLPADLAKMRGNAQNLMDGRMDPEKFLARWERTPPAPAPEPVTPVEPIVVTDVTDRPAPETHTERAVVEKPERPLSRTHKLQDRVQQLETELAEAQHLFEFSKQDLEQEVTVLRDELKQLRGEASAVGGGTAWAEVRKLQAEKRSYQAEMMRWQAKYEDERRLANALKRQLKKYIG